MKTKFAFIFACSSLLCSHLAQADPGWTDYVTVAELVPTSRHYYEVRLPVKDNPSGCSDKNGFYQDYDSTGADKMYSTLLEGIKSGIKFRVYVTGKCNLNGYAEFSSVSIAP